MPVIRRNEREYTIGLIPETWGRVAVNIEKPTYKLDGKSCYKSGVSWLSFGALPSKAARKFAEAVLEACDIADKLQREFDEGRKRK